MRTTVIAPLTLLLALSACKTTGATYGSGVGDAILEHAPYYAGQRVAADPAQRIAHFPIAYQRGATQMASFDPAGERGTPMAQLLAEMNAYLDSLGTAAGATVRVGALPAGTPPDVRFGCETEPGASLDECLERDDRKALGRGGEYMMLAVGRPSSEWIASAAQAIERAGATRGLVLTLETTNYLPRQRGWRGSKSVELGTDYSVNLPWLTSLETPVMVLQLTGALVERDGRALRIGAEGMMPKRTPLVASGLGAQALLTDEDVQALRALRRDDLAGRPLVWQAALRTIVAELTGRRDLAPR